jgi:hypothetical protein
MFMKQKFVLEKPVLKPRSYPAILKHGSITEWATFIPPPPSKNDIFPLSRQIIFWLLSYPFCLNSSHLAFILPFYFTFSLSIPLFPFSFHTFFSYIFLPFSLSFVLFFSLNDVSWYSPRGGWYFPIYRPLPLATLTVFCVPIELRLKQRKKRNKCISPSAC